MTRREKIINTYADKHKVSLERAEEIYLSQMRKRAAKGGKAKVPKGFAKNIELARKAGSKGGQISKRTKKPVE